MRREAVKKKSVCFTQIYNIFIEKIIESSIIQKKHYKHTHRDIYLYITSIYISNIKIENKSI